MLNRIQQRINELIKQELSKIILKEIEFPQEVLVTLTRVETSSDLRNSNVYVSIISMISSENKNELVISQHKNSKILEILNKNIYTLQQKLNKRLRMRLIPKIKFLEEKTIDNAIKIEEILEKLKK